MKTLMFLIGIFVGILIGYTISHFLWLEIIEKVIIILKTNPIPV
jgi:uncharacterized membrane protein YwzB